ncbi:MAG: PPC domain-containing protein [Anaerolineae bacterium]|nr:PPC domain-containing protein [Anaerolineae bacterium]
MFRRVVIVVTVLILLVSAVRAQEPVTLTYDQLVEGHVKPALPMEFTFAGAQGEAVVVSMTSAEFDTSLELLDPSGSVIAFDDDSGVAANALLQTTLPASGVYTIRAGSYDDQQSGHFHLSLTLAEAAGASPTGAAAYGQTLDGHLTAGGRDRWTFSGTAGERLQISMTSAEFDAYLELYDPAGQQIASNDDFGGGYDSLLEITLPVTGAYTIVARSYSSDASGTYRLALSQVGAADEQQTEEGTGTTLLPLIVEGVLSSSDGDRWVFTGLTGDSIRITMTSADFDAFLELYDPLDRLAVNDDDGAGATDALIETSFTISGEFVIVARAQGSEIGGGAYHLRVEWVSGTPDTTLRRERAARVIQYGETREGVLLPGARDRWTFQGAAGDVVTITLTSSDFDALLELYGPRDEGLDEDDDSAGNSNARITSFRLSESGVFTIVVRAYLESMTGAYLLSLQPG